MARRLTLLALLLACAMAARPPQHFDSDSDSFDPFADWSEYEDSIEPPRRVHTEPPRIRTPKPNSAKVILRAKRPIVNATVKNTKSENKKNIVKTTTINIESYTNFIVTKKPNTKLKSPTKRPPAHEQEKLVIELDDSVEPVRIVKRPPAKKPTTTTRRTPVRTTPRPPARTTKRTTTRRPVKTTKNPSKKKTTCPPKHSGWISSFFANNITKKVKKPTQANSWLSGIFTRISKWIWGSNGFSPSNWFGNLFNENQSKNTKATTTTPMPLTTTETNSWFYKLIESEEDDNVFVANETKKAPKKSLKKNYKGYQLLRTYPDAQWKVRELLDLEDEAQGSGVMWWTPPSINGSTDLLVPPDLLTDIKDHLKSNKIDFDVVIWDLQKAIMYENPRLSKKQRLELEQVRGHPMTWKRYHRYSDMLRYLEYLQHSYSDIVELKPMGRSSEGLPLVAVKISIPGNESIAKESKEKKKKWRLKSRMKPAVFIEGGAHGREWISPAVATWILKTLVEGEKGIGIEHEVLEQADFYIMPVVNPDGYEHSHTHDRLWRKTRSRYSDLTDDYYIGWFPWNWGRTECVGVDADRNWDYHWGETGASRDPCSDQYAGPHPFSEPETRAVSAFLAEHRDQMKVYISLHAYSQAWLVPSSHAQHAPFSDDGVLMEMGKLATAALADLYGTKYQVGTAAEIRQPASGMSHDWAKARAGVKYSYHVNLRDSFGPYGFLLPGSQIEPTAKETWQAVKAIVDNLNG